jgi:hypothetical protein
MADNIKLTGTDKKTVTDQSYIEDYADSQVIGKVRIGQKALYYKDGLKRYCVPFGYIDRAFTRINECNARTCCCSNSFDYFRLILVHDGKEFANIIFDQDESPVDQAEQLLKERRPEIEIGYIKPEK